MNTNELIRKMIRIDGFAGVYPCDLLPNKMGNGGIIINTDESSEPGTHWVAVYIENGRGEYFDSYGRDPQREIIRFLNRNAPLGYKVVNVGLQAIDSSVCGNYCILFLAFRLKGYSITRFLSLYSKVRNVNDFITELLT